MACGKTSVSHSTYTILPRMARRPEKALTTCPSSSLGTTIRSAGNLMAALILGTTPFTLSTRPDKEMAPRTTTRGFSLQPT